MSIEMAAATAVTALVAVVLAVSLFGLKVYHWQRDRIRGARRAHYIAAVGEMLARGLSAPDDRGWAEDPLFHEVLLQYFDVVAGEERAHLERLITEVDLRNRMVAQLREAKRTSSRLEAAAHLSIAASPEVEWALLEALESPTAEIKIHAAAGLAKIESDRAIPKLVHMLLTEEPWVSSRVADQLVEYGSKAVDLLVENIRDEHGGRLVRADVLTAIVRVLGYIGDLGATPAIVPLLDHPAVDVRVAAAGALGTAGTPASVTDLVRALDDPRWEVRARAASSLAMFSDPETAQPLADRLRDSSWWVRQNAAESLVEIPGGLEALIEALEGDDAYARDAALQQLGLTGMIRSATERVARDEPQSLDRRLVDAVALPSPVPYSERADLPESGHAVELDDVGAS